MTPLFNWNQRSTQSINFLDTTVFKGKNFNTTHQLEVKVYFKKTDLHALLFKSSFHSKYVFRGLVKSQLLRFHRICTRSGSFMEAVTILFNSLRKKGYSRQFLRHCLRHFKEEKQEDGGSLIPLITTFDSVSQKLNGKVTSIGTLSSPEILPNFKVISAYRRNANLKDLLVHAKLPSLHVEKPQKCGTILQIGICKKY